METVKDANDWFYYAVPTSQSGNFSLSISADKAVSTYVLKGDYSLPGTDAFDMLLKNETKVTLSSNLMNFDQGAIVAVHCSDEMLAENPTRFKVQLHMLKDANMAASDGSSGFLDLAASAVPLPAPAIPLPGFEKGNGDDKEGGAAGDTDAQISMLSNWQYIMLGAFLGILATVIYYKLAKFF